MHRRAACRQRLAHRGFVAPASTAEVATALEASVQPVLSTSARHHLYRVATVPPHKTSAPWLLLLSFRNYPWFCGGFCYRCNISSQNVLLFPALAIHLGLLPGRLWPFVRRSVTNAKSIKGNQSTRRQLAHDLAQDNLCANLCRTFGRCCVARLRWPLVKCSCRLSNATAIST